MKKTWTVLTPLLLASSAFAAPAPANPVLQATMLAISDDVTTVAVPTTVADPADVTDDQVYAAIAHSRTAAYQFQLIMDRRSGEMLPPSLAGLTAAQKQTKLASYANFLQQVKAKLTLAEQQLLSEAPKLPENRNFAPLKSTIADLGAIEASGHQIFNP